MSSNNQQGQKILFSIHLVLHESTRVQTFSRLEDLLCAHNIDDVPFLIVISIQHSPIVARWYPLKNVFSPMWLTVRLSNNVLLNTVSQSVYRTRFTWIVGLVQILISYRLKC